MKFVAGFLISEDYQQVALLKKSRPVWQKGRFNAIGGKIEEGETPTNAMSREFLEEAGLLIDERKWEHFAFLEGPDWECYFFRTWGDPYQCKTQDLEEPISVFEVNKVKTMTSDQVISNIPWLLGIALNTSGGIAYPVKINYE